MDVTADQLGRQGERKFDDLCELAGLIVSELHPDMTGRDRHVEFPFVEPTGHITYDTRPAPLACYVQIKTLLTTSTSFKMRLSAAERLARETKPAFVCILRMNDQREFVDLYLLHLYDAALAAILKRLRVEHAKRSSHLNRLWISFSISSAKKVELSPLTLRDAIQAEIADGMHAYAVRKQQQLSEIGYEEGRIRLNVTFNSVKMGDLVDGFLGLSNLPVSTVEGFERRFGIDLPNMPQVTEADASNSHTFKVHPTPVDRCIFSLTNPKTGETATIEGDLYHPGIPGLEPEFMKLLIRSRLMNITIERQNVHLKTNDEFGPGKRQPLEIWLENLRAFAMLTEGGATGAVRIQKLHGEIALPRLDALNPSGDHRWIRRAMTVVDAALKLRRLASADDDAVDLDALMREEQAITRAYSLMSGGGKAGSLQYTTDLPDQFSLQEMPIVALSVVRIGDHLYAYALRSRVTPRQDRDGVEWTSQELIPLLIEKLREQPVDDYNVFRAKIVNLTGINYLIEQDAPTGAAS